MAYKVKKEQYINKYKLTFYFDNATFSLVKPQRCPEATLDKVL